VVSKAQCGQFNINKKETKTNASAYSRYRFVIHEGSPKGISENYGAKGFAKQMMFKSGVKRQGTEW